MMMPDHRDFRFFAAIFIIRFPWNLSLPLVVFACSLRQPCLYSFLSLFRQIVRPFSSLVEIH
jgi:hypothetical protein